jgi:polysaccharide pyruvyl transferase WcaK-like protein/MoaA/NifB/PqqE/SkfB family radical SAM enzyme
MTNNKFPHKIIIFADILSYLFKWYVNPGRSRKPHVFPRVLNLLVTEDCNCRCLMCNVWERDSLRQFSPQELHTVLEDSLFKHLRHVGISGGEPTLRNDLVELCGVILNTLPGIKSLSLTTNGSRPEVLANILPAVRRFCDRRNVNFTLNISLDGIGDVHERMRNRVDIYNSVLKSIQTAKTLGIKVQLQCTVSSCNVYSVEGVRFMAQEYGIDIVYRVATTIARLQNEAKIKEIALNDNQISFFADFLTAPGTLNQTRMPTRILFYHDLAKRLLTGGERKAPCYFQHEGVMLSASGDFYICSISTTSLGNVFESKPRDLYFSESAVSIRNTIISDDCPTCLHDQSGAWSPFMLLRGMLLNRRWTIVMNKLKIASRFFSSGYYLLAVSRCLTSRVQALPITTSSDGGKKALLIGCYGGEHVGDAAILGGVLQRIRRDFHVNQAIIVSSRPDRTRRWANSLRECIDTSVIFYDSALIDANLLECDYLVFAGGPLMDLPVLLVNHLQTAIKAKRNNIPIIIEGCGIGPFQFTLSKLIVRRLLEMATHVRLRTKYSVDIAAQWHVAAMLDKDPAFDYLNSLAVAASNPACVHESLQKLLETQKKIIGINLRPLWQKYAKGFLSAQKIREIEDNFLEEFSQALLISREDIRYIFFPMNPDQYGFSDLSIAYRLQKKLNKRVDFHIWEYEPDVDEVLYLLNRATACIAMRFHASIFSLSQGIFTIGIDYGVGQKSKVGDLFNELGLKDRVISVDKFNYQWLNEILLNRLI